MLMPRRMIALSVASFLVTTGAVAQTTVTLQQGLNTYTGAADDWINGGSGATINRGSSVEVDMRATSDYGLFRFSIFQSEGGPVPNGANINSATLSLYKAFGPDAVFKASRLLKSWTEMGATWNSTGTGASWSTPGAQGAGTDVLGTADGQGSAPDSAANNCADGIGHPPCWLNIDVTTGVRAFGSGASQNFGWLIQQVSSSGEFTYKDFNSKENTNFPQYRPKLTVTYTVAPPPPPSGSATATLQQGLNAYAGAADDWINGGSGADVNRGSSVEVDMRSTSDYGLFRFSIFQSEGGPVPNGATINSATLSLYKAFGPDAVFKASRLLKSWTEMGATWNTTGTGTPWSTPGAQGPGTDVLATADGQGSAPDSAANNCADGIGHEICWLNVDVTTGVRAFASGASQNFGWLIQQVSSSGEFTYKDFNSKDVTNFPQYRPKLTINYNPGGCTSAPTASFTATPSSGTAPLPVSFDASASADGSSAITSLTLQFGDGAQVTWASKTQAQSHSYTSPATYTATLTATSSCGTSAAVTRQITVTPGPGPTAQLVATPQSGTLTASFDASGSVAGGSPITGLRLQFNDGTADATWTDKAQVQSHTYPSAGTRNATLTVTDQNGLASSVTVSVTVSVSTSDVLPAEPAAGNLAFTVPTFHSMSLYYSTQTTDPQIWMRYRKSTEPNTAWRTGFPLWVDPRTTDGNTSPVTNTLPFTAAHPVSGTVLQYRARGSAVTLDPGTKYYFEFGTGPQGSITWQHYVEGTTWQPAFPENAAVTTIPSQNSVFVIPATGGGNASAYKVYDGWNGASKNVVNRLGQNLTTDRTIDASHAIVVKASFVIVRRVRATGSALAGIYVAPGVTDVVIEDSQVDDWSWQAGTTSGEPNPNSWGTWGQNEEGGIHLAGNNSRIVVQRNVIRAPHFGAFPWDTSSNCDTVTPASPQNHPIGPNGISFETAGQQNVVRYNEITGDPANRNTWYMDGVGGGENFSPQGSPGADSDIYQNIIMNVFDDAIEAEGGGRNVRIWGNYLSEVKSAVATTTVHFGPTYIWRNVVNHIRTCYQLVADNNPAGDWPTNAFKMGGWDDVRPGEGYGNGIRYLLHNTVLQSAGAFGAEVVVEPTSNGAGSVAWTIAHNNILQTRDETHFGWSIQTGDTPTGSDFAANMCNGRVDTAIPQPVAPYVFTASQLFYKAGNGASSVPALGGGGTGSYQLDPSSRGIDVGQVLPNFNDGFLGTAPDAGAHESGSAASMRFGITAGQ